MSSILADAQEMKCSADAGGGKVYVQVQLRCTYIQVIARAPEAAI